jgi:excisionase family DNA binding protein
MNEKLFTTEALAELLHVSPRTVLRERLAGKISYKKIRGRIRFTQVDVDKYLERQSHLSSNVIGKELKQSEKVRIFSGRR